MPRYGTLLSLASTALSLSLATPQPAAAQRSNQRASAERPDTITDGVLTSILLTWNATHCCAQAMRNHVDDVGFISALIDRLVAQGRADPNRIYVTGMSNGAMMTHVVGRELSNKLAAIAMQLAQDEGRGLRGRLMARRTANKPVADRDVAPAEVQAQYWSHADGCTDPGREAGDTPVKTFNASEVIWDFFSHHVRQP
jgi:hypothetical protein